MRNYWVDIVADSGRLNRLSAAFAFYAGLVLLGLLLAAITWTMLAPSRPAEEHRPARPSVPAVAEKQYSPLDLINSLNQFNPWETVPVAVPKSAGPAALPAKAVPSTLDLTLIGTLVLSDQAGSRAALAKKKEGKEGMEQLFLAPGDKVDGAVLEKIERNAVYFKRDGRYEIIRMELVKEPRGKNASVPGGGGVDSAGGHRQGTGLRLEGGRFEALVTQGADLLKGVSISPYYSGSKSLGYQLNFTDEAGVFAEFGVQSGDVIEKINGVPVTDTAEMTRLLEGIRNKPTINIELLRDGAPRSVQIGIDR